jgi:hypothetical protein
MTCKYCGKEAKNSGSLLLAGGSSTCSASPAKKHVIVPDGEHCVFCGKEARNSGSSLFAGGSSTCSVSSSKKHQLDD